MLINRKRLWSEQLYSKLFILVNLHHLISPTQSSPPLSSALASWTVHTGPAGVAQDPLQPANVIRHPSGICAHPPQKPQRPRLALPHFCRPCSQVRLQHTHAHTGEHASSSIAHTRSTQDLYISFTVHYVDSNWDLQTHCLQTHYLPNDQTEEVTMESLTETRKN